ncbi:hypothetical protein [Spirobacillus cienkowskii]|uniref:hypothetical protein n=1 Tax=Spirobacillus cienkowskii TaxID=495820 RepID=UPI0030D39839
MKLNFVLKTFLIILLTISSKQSYSNNTKFKHNDYLYNSITLAFKSDLYNRKFYLNELIKNYNFAKKNLINDFNDIDKLYQLANSRNTKNLSNSNLLSRYNKRILLSFIKFRQAEYDFRKIENSMDNYCIKKKENLSSIRLKYADIISEESMLNLIYMEEILLKLCNKEFNYTNNNIPKLIEEIDNRIKIGIKQINSHYNNKIYTLKQLNNIIQEINSIKKSGKPMLINKYEDKFTKYYIDSINKINKKSNS